MGEAIQQVPACSHMTESGRPERLDEQVISPAATMISQAPDQRRYCR